MNVGQTVSLKVDNKTVYGQVRTEPTATPSGYVVKVQLLPDFAHLLPTGWTDAGVEDLTPVKVCACATLAYRPIWGQHKGELITTGCDFSRRPSRKATFLPGHDAKAKGFLIKAAGYAQTLENGLGALEQAREFGDKISLAVAKGIDNDRKRSAARTASRRQRSLVDSDPAPATREDDLTDAQRLHRELNITEPMLQVLARAATDSHESFRGDLLSVPTGTLVALKKRGLSDWGQMTDMAYRVLDLPTLAESDPHLVVCSNEQGSYVRHNFHWDGDERVCRRCGTADEDN